MIAVLLSLTMMANTGEDLLALHGTELSSHWVHAKRVAPEYPRMAAKRGVQGCARVGFVIDTDGSVNESRILVEHPTAAKFGKAAERAVKKWAFMPSEANTDREPVYTTQVITFMLARITDETRNLEAEAPCEDPVLEGVAIGRPRLSIHG